MKFTIVDGVKSKTMSLKWDVTVSYHDELWVFTEEGLMIMGSDEHKSHLASLENKKEI